MWVDIFTRKAYMDIIVDILKYYQQNKGLEIYAFVITTNHIHLIVRSKETHRLSDTIRDLRNLQPTNC
jgi:putative transposase